MPCLAIELVASNLNTLLIAKHFAEQSLLCMLATDCLH